MSGRTRAMLLVAAMPALVASAGAQSLAIPSIAGRIAVSAVVLPLASFDGGSVRTLSIRLAPGDSARVEPSAGVRTRLTYSVPTRVTVRATSFVGPEGHAVTARLLCAYGRDATSSPDVAFDCGAGYIAPTGGDGARILPLGIGAAIAARDTRRLPAGLYTATVTLTASAPGY